MGPLDRNGSYIKKFNEEDLCYSVKVDYYSLKNSSPGMVKLGKDTVFIDTICPNFFPEYKQQKIISKLNRPVKFVPASEVSEVVWKSLKVGARHARDSSNKDFFIYSESFYPYKFNKYKSFVGVDFANDKD